MKILRIKNTFKKAALIFLLFFGISVGFKFDKGSNIHFPVSINVSLLKPLHATEDQWSFVRGSASWARGNSLFMDDVIGSIQGNAGIVLLASQSGGIVQHNFSTNAGTNFTISIKLGGSFTAGSTVYPSTKTFSNYLELRTEGTDGSNSNDIALQFYWDDNPRDSSLDGALVKYRLHMLNPAEETGIADIESYIYSPDVTPGGYYDTLGFPNQGLVQVYSWDNKLANDTELAKNALRGRVILEEMDNKEVFCFKTVVRVEQSANLIPDFFPNQAFCPGTSGNEYYKLAYSQELTGGLEVIAKSGWEEGAITPVAYTNDDTFCSLFTINYGIFDVNGFVKDGVSLASAPTYEHINATRVSKLYSRIGTTGKSGNPSGTPGVDYDSVQWDDLTKSTIDAIDVQFSTTPTL